MGKSAGEVHECIRERLHFPWREGARQQSLQVPRQRTCERMFVPDKSKCKSRRHPTTLLVTALLHSTQRGLKPERSPLPVFSSVQSLSRVQLFLTPWTAALQASLSITNSQRLLKLVHRVSDAIQPSHPLSLPSPPTFNLSQHQGLFQ